MLAALADPNPTVVQWLCIVAAVLFLLGTATVRIKAISQLGEWTLLGLGFTALAIALLFVV